MDEVAQHNKDDDCWFVIHGKVYDVNGFMLDHPGQANSSSASSSGRSTVSDGTSIALCSLSLSLFLRFIGLLCFARLGGPEVMTQEAGTDATQKFEELSHSEDARKQLADFCVGTLAGYTGPKDAEMQRKKVSSNVATQETSTSPAVYIAAAAAIAVLVYVFVL